MHKTIPPCYLKVALFLFLSLLTITSCQKEEQSNISPIGIQQGSVLGENKVYFEREIAGKAGPNDDGNLRHHVVKTPLWRRAQTVQLSIGPALKVPLAYHSQVFVQVGRNKTPVPLSQLSYLLMYKDKNQVQHIEVVTRIPDETCWQNGNNRNNAFSGIILVEDWWGRPITTFKKTRQGQFIRTGNPVMAAVAKAEAPQNLDAPNQDCEVIVTIDENRMYNVEYTCHEHPGGDGGGGGGWDFPNGGGGGGQGPEPGDYGMESFPHHGGGGGGGGHRNDNPTPNTLDTTMSREFYQNEKTMCALNKLMQNNYYKSALNQFIGENKPIDLTFKLEPIANPNVLGHTVLGPQGWNSNNVDIILNKNVIANSPSIEVALTLLHEGIHAEIFRKILSINGPSNLNMDNFPSLFNMFAQYKGYQHEFLANYYIDIMSKALKQYDNNKFGIEYYKALAWSGLEGTNVYISLDQSKKADIQAKMATVLANRSRTNCND